MINFKECYLVLQSEKQKTEIKKQSTYNRAGQLEIVFKLMNVIIIIVICVKSIKNIILCEIIFDYYIETKKIVFFSLFFNDEKRNIIAMGNCDLNHSTCMSLFDILINPALAVNNSTSFFLFWFYIWLDLTTSTFIRRHNQSVCHFGN